MFNSQQLTGRTGAHVRELPDLGCTVHEGMEDALRALRAAAHTAGIELTVVSAFRDFQRQAAIWNGKFRGERPLFDRYGEPLSREGLDEPALIEAILQWSALPGASRHHWGTDFDVIDSNALPPAGRLPLLAAHFGPRGVFAKLDAWLGANMRRFGFFRPYSSDRGGVLPEPWHLSYGPLAVPALESFTLEALRETIESSELCGRERVLGQLEQIFRRYVKAVDPP
jgi:LAS superfamily LD-carboxypeptidase LdcB